MASLKISLPNSKLDGDEMPLPTEGRVRIGRDPDNELVLVADMISRAHAEIVCASVNYHIADMGSKVGTFVGKEKIQARVTLKHRDKIRIGPAVLVFHNSPAPAASNETAVPQPLARETPSAPKLEENNDFAVPEQLYSDEVMALKRRIHEQVLAKLNLREIASKQIENDEMRQKLEQTLDRVLKESLHEIPRGVTQDLLRQAMLDELVAYGPITPMLRDGSVTEVMVNSASRIFVERKGLLTETRARFFDDLHLMIIIRRIVEPLGRHVDESCPKVDARLPDGSRVNAIIPPLALDGPALTIRKFPERKLTTEDLIEFGTLTPTMAAFLQEAVRARQNIVVSGGTGSGKTTLLNILSQFIPQNERIVTIEDSAELKLTHRNLVRLESRPPNIEGKGRILIHDLVINALRMRPDRIVVGECRGAEALDMLQAMNTGHDGSLTTVHANSGRDSLSRLETMVMMAGYDLPSKAIRDQIASAVNLIVQQSRLVDGSRKIETISEITGREKDVILMQDIFVFEQQGFDKRGKVLGAYKATGNKPSFIAELKKKGDLRLDPSIFNTTE